MKAVITRINQLILVSYVRERTSDKTNKNTKHSQRIECMKQESASRENAHNGQSSSKVLADPPCNHSTRNSTLNYKCTVSRCLMK